MILHVGQVPMLIIYKQWKESLMPPDIPTVQVRWSFVAQDLFTIHYRSYHSWLLSDFWEFDPVDESSSETIIECTKIHFAQYGIPEMVHSSQIIAHSLKPNFAKQWGFSHITSSAYYSNGKAESAVKIAKSMLKKVTQERMVIKLAILSWCSTSTEGGEHSHVQKLHSVTRTLTHLTKKKTEKSAVEWCMKLPAESKG